LAGGLAKESSYPYTSAGGNAGTCTVSSSSRYVSISSYTLVGSYPPSANEESMAAYLQSTGPIAKTICATDLRSYVSGAITTCTESPLNHVVQLVGEFFTLQIWLLYHA